MIIVGVILFLASFFALRSKSEDKENWGKRLFEVISLKVTDYYFKGSPAKVTMLFLRFLFGIFETYAIGTPLVRLSTNKAINNSSWEILLQWSAVDTTVTIVFALLASIVVTVYLIMNKQSTSSEEKLDKIQEDTQELKNSRDLILERLDKANSASIKHLLPVFRKDIEALNVKSANQYLDKIQEEVKLNYPNDKALLASIYCYKARCVRFIKGVDSKPIFEKAYALMSESGEIIPEVVEGALFVNCIKRNFEVSKQLAKDLYEIDSNNPWCLVPQLLFSDDYEKECRQIPDSIQKTYAIGIVVTLGGTTAQSFGFDISTYKINPLESITYDNIPLWILNLSVALTRFVQTLTLTMNATDEQKCCIGELFELTDKYLKLLQNTQLDNFLPESKYVHAYTAFMQDKDTKWIDEIKDTDYSKEHKELYYLLYANMLYVSGRYDEAMLLLQGYGDDAKASILNYRMVIAAATANAQEFKDVFVFAAAHRTIIPDHLAALFYDVTRVYYTEIKEQAKDLVFEENLTHKLYQEYLNYNAGVAVDVDFLKNNESSFDLFLLPFIAQIYSDRLGIDEAVNLLKPYVDVARRSPITRSYIEYLRKEKKYTQELYHLLQNIRNNGIIEDDLLSLELAIAENGIQDYKVCLEITTLFIERHPDDGDVLWHHLMALSNNVGNNEEIRAYKEKLIRVELPVYAISSIFNIYHIIDENAFALELLYQYIQKTRNQDLREFFYHRSLHHDFSSLIYNTKKQIELTDYVEVKEEGITGYVEVTDGSVYETLVGKGVGDICKLENHDQTFVEIIEIHNKYFKLAKDVAEDVYENRAKTMWSININDEDFKNDPLGTLMRLAGNTEETREAEKSSLNDYRKGEHPIFSFLHGENPIAGYYELLFGDFMVCGFPNETLGEVFKEEHSVDHYKIVLDLSSLILMHEVSVRYGLNVSIKFLLPLKILNVIKGCKLNEEKGFPSMFTDRVRNNVSLTITDSTKSTLWNKLNMLEKWIRENCQLENVEEKLNYDFSHLKSKELNLEDESVMLAIRKGNLLLTENWFWTSKFFNLFPSMNVGNWLYLSNFNKYNDYAEWVFRMNHMGVPMTAEQIVIQYEEFAKGNTNYYNACLSNIDYNHYTYNEVFAAGDKILQGLYVPSRIQAVTNMITLVLKNLSAPVAAGVYCQVKDKSVNKDFNNCVFSALRISHPELFEKGYNGILV